MMIVQIGKHGDIINVLPLAFMLHKKLGGKIPWVVGEKWASTLEGATYVEPRFFNGTDDALHFAIDLCQRGQKLLVTQAWKHPDPTRQTDSFALEQWRYAGVLGERGKWPLIFDNRDVIREQSLVAKFIRKDRKNVLVGTDSVSTPYRNWVQLLERLYQELPDVNIVPLRKVKAERIYDLIALYDAADLVISVDTAHCHLIRASQTPLIMLQNDGWMGMNPPPPQCIASWRYAELGDNLTAVVEAAKKQLSRKVESLAVVLQTFNPNTDRHKRAMATHPKDSIYSRNENPPPMKHLLQQGLDANKDVIIFTHDDVTFLPYTLDKIRKHATKFDFGCSRRPRTPVHCGREIFWFRSDWLLAHWDSIPNPYWSVQKPDLIMCRWMRHLRGIPTTLENLDYDFPPVDVPDIIYHAEHLSHWNTDEILNSKEGLYNEWLWSQSP
jgi:hypothetical protein